MTNILTHLLSQVEKISSQFIKVSKEYKVLKGSLAKTWVDLGANLEASMGFVGTLASELTE
jgi:hypothetical protein